MSAGGEAAPADPQPCLWAPGTAPSAVPQSTLIPQACATSLVPTSHVIHRGCQQEPWLPLGGEWQPWAGGAGWGFSTSSGLKWPQPTQHRAGPTRGAWGVFPHRKGRVPVSASHRLGEQGRPHTPHCPPPITVELGALGPRPASQP